MELDGSPGYSPTTNLCTLVRISARTRLISALRPAGAPSIIEIRRGGKKKRWTKKGPSTFTKNVMSGNGAASPPSVTGINQRGWMVAASWLSRAAACALPCFVVGGVGSPARRLLILVRTLNVLGE